MARSTMAALIAKLRLMVGDPAGASQTFSDDEIEDALDANRREVRYERLYAAPTYRASGAVDYLDYYAGDGPWESDAALYDYTWTMLTPATSDYWIGYWTFAANRQPPVFIVGKCYDVNGAAADVLEMWAAKVARQFDYKSGPQEFARSQQAAGLRAEADRYRQRAWTETARMVRGD